uniref:cysteine-rich and transmembrane domain-containing protein WIH2-like n=1 Tax=Erigeron canadensis TaxID=72917 RepID=UPI001CB97DC0|nr:cysteine-rich and transmembrane domain-containing protein WIH2-like [Erigeron canadensis]
MSNPDYPPPSSGTYASNTIYPPPPPGYPSVPPQPPYNNAGYPPPQPPTYAGVYQYHDPSVGGPVTGYSYPPPSPQRPGYQGYFAPQNYPPPPQPPPYQVYHCEHECYDDHDGCSSFLRGCMAALCFCCILDECCGY